MSLDYDTLHGIMYDVRDKHNAWC